MLAQARLRLDQQQGRKINRPPVERLQGLDDIAENRQLGQAELEADLFVAVVVLSGKVASLR